MHRYSRSPPTVTLCWVLCARNLRRTSQVNGRKPGHSALPVTAIRYVPIRALRPWLTTLGTPESDGGVLPARRMSCTQILLLDFGNSGDIPLSSTLAAAAGSWAARMPAQGNRLPSWNSIVVRPAGTRSSHSRDSCRGSGFVVSVPNLTAFPARGNPPPKRRQDTEGTSPTVALSPPMPASRPFPLPSCR